MKYFGKKSLSSAVSGILRVVWYVLIVGSVIAVAAGVMFLFVIPPEATGASGGVDSAFDSVPEKTLNDWAAIRNAPVVLRVLMFPYFGVVLAFLLLIVYKTRLLFFNFKNEKIFSKSNVVIISKISKLLIVFSILTFRLFLIVVAILLLLLCEVFKSGAHLQEEHDLTV